MNKLSDEKLTALLALVTKVGPQKIPPGTPCFWDTKDRVACTYDDLRAVIVELQALRALVGTIPQECDGNVCHRLRSIAT